MNKLKKVGLTALAGSLVASAAYAGEMAVGGSWEISYESLDSDESQPGTSRSPWSMADSITFTGTGETDQGYGIAYYVELDGGTYDDYSLKMDLGDSGTIKFSGASHGGSGIQAVNNMVPNANDAAYAWTGDSDTTGSDGVAPGATDTGNFGYDATFGSIGVSAEIAQDDGTEHSWSVTYSDLMDGLTVGGGMSEIDTANMNSGTEGNTLFVKYAMGGLTAAYQISEVDALGAGETDQDGTHIGASFAVNDSLSVAVGRQTVEFTGAVEDEKNTALTASYTMGSMTVKGYSAKTENANGAAGAADDTESGFSVGFAF